MYDYTLDLPNGQRLVVSVGDDSWQWEDQAGAEQREHEDGVTRCRLRYLEYSWHVVEREAA